VKDISKRAYNIADLREIARHNLPRGLFEFVDRGSEDEVGLRHNRAAFERIKLRPRRLIDVSARNQGITLFGHELKIPIAIAPTGSGGLMWYEGELAQARAAAAAGIPFTVATGSMIAMERVVAEAGGCLWFQLYMWSDRSLSHQLVKRASDAGYEALVVTIDSAVPSNREYNSRNGYTVPFTFNRNNVTDVLMHPRWLLGVLARYVVTTGMPCYENYPSARKNRITARPMDRAKLKNDSLNWEDLRTLRTLWPRTLVVKGILSPEDAILAADCGADGIVVSNHGGRNFDSYQAPIEVLPEVVDAVGQRITVLVDSGFRRGTDVVKALALGAKAVLVGRPTLYGAAAAGEAGARLAIAMFRKEIDRTLAHLGCNSVAELNRNHLRPAIEAQSKNNPPQP
jgi:isopentenyl diphosphate isomerase/L-lactate dehydrogenase-like FMN-dependent dehydrogenase